VAVKTHEYTTISLSNQALSDAAQKPVIQQYPKKKGTLKDAFFNFLEMNVARPRIELGTHGFSVRFTKTDL